MIFDPASRNPFAGNPLRSRADVVKALHDSFNPLLPFFVKGGGAAGCRRTGYGWRDRRS